MHMCVAMQRVWHTAVTCPGGSWTELCVTLFELNSRQLWATHCGTRTITVTESDMLDALREADQILNLCFDIVNQIHTQIKAALNTYTHSVTHTLQKFSQSIDLIKCDDASESCRSHFKC